MKPRRNRKTGYYLVAVLLMVLASRPVTAQESLGLREAISIALEHNHGISTARLAQQQADNNNTVAEAGFLPRVDVGAGYSTNELQIRQELADGRLILRNGANSQLTEGEAILTWTLFDGLVMFSRKERLVAEAETARLQLRLSMETTIGEVIAAYFAVRVEEDRINALDELLGVDSIRVALAEMRLLNGSGARPDFLQASISRNMHRAEKMELISALAGHRERLNLLLGRKPDVEFFTTDSITLQDIRIDESGRDNDVNLLLSRQQKRTAFQWLQEAKGGRYPTLNFNASYRYTRTDNEAGFLLENRNSGPGYGFTLRWNLFDGLRTSRIVKNAGLQLQAATLLEEQAMNNRLREERLQQRRFDFLREQARLDEDAVKWSRENLDIAVERMRSGLSSALELQEAERSYREAVTRCTVSLYNAKLSETEVLRLRGELVK